MPRCAPRFLLLLLILPCCAPLRVGAEVFTVGAFVLPGPVAQQKFGSSLVASDLDADVDDDLILGGTTATGSGEIRVYRTTGRGLALIASETGTQADQRFGEALAEGHFFHGMVEFRSQLAIGSPGGRASSPGGAVTIEMLSGSLMNVVVELEQGLDGMPGADESGDEFGAALAVGDFNGDGYDDLAIGAPGEDLGALADAGAVWVVYGTDIGLDPSTGELWTQDTANVPGADEAGDQFGFALAAGDFNDDNIDDLAIGAPGEEVSGLAAAGAVTILTGSAGGINTTGAALLWQQDGTVPGVLEAGDRFGEVLAAGDLVRNAASQYVDDLAIGVPHEAVGSLLEAGAVIVLPGTDTGLTGTAASLFTQDDFVGGLAETGDHFGGSLAIGMLRIYTERDLVVGAPDEDHAGATDAGVAYILFGRTSSLSASDAQFVPRQLPGTTVAAGVHESAALAVADIDDDSPGDLVLGMPGYSTLAPNVGGVQVLFGALFADGFDYGNYDAWPGSAP